MSLIEKATEFLSKGKHVFARVGEGITFYIAECGSETEAANAAGIMEGLRTKARVVWCESCSQPYDMVAPNGRYTDGHELTCSGVITGIGCNCPRAEWPICDQCGQKRPPKIERCSCRRIVTKKMQCTHQPGKCQNMVLETDYPKVCKSCGHKMEQLYTESVNG